MKRVLLAPNDVVGEKMAAPGIRYFHFARELARDGRFDVTLMVLNDPQQVQLDGVRVIGTAPRRHRQLRDLARSSDVIVAQGGLDSRSMVHLAGTGVRTIYDLYAPFFEMLTFQGGAADHGAEQRLRWRAYCLRHRLLLSTGRAFISASEDQRHALLGGLAAVGRIGLEDYRRDPTLGHLVRAVGLGVELDPPRPTVDDVRATLPQARDGDRILIWPGNLWDWFDPDTLMRAMAKISATRQDIKLFCLGLRHPSTSGYGKMTTTDRALGLAEALGIKDRTVFFDFGWIPYRERQNYLLAADIGINIHGRHVETTFSYRTRLLDYFWASLPIVTTEGGALSDVVERNGLGRTVRYGDVDDCARAILELCDDHDEYARVRERVARFRQEMTWQRAVEPLAELIEAPQSGVSRGPAVRGLAVRYAAVRARAAASGAARARRPAGGGGGGLKGRRELTLADAVRRGVRVMVARDVAIRVLTMTGGLVLAILLGPAAFGVWAVGLGLVAALQAVTRGGLGAALLRRAEAPTQGELNALVTFQLVFGVVVAACGLGLAFVLLPALGAPAHEAQAICLALLALPISSPRVAPTCVLERDLEYVSLSVLDVSEQLALYTVAVVLAGLGAGIWSLAPAACAAAAAGVAAGLAVSRVRARLTRRLGVLRRIWRFGATFQLSETLYAVRDSGLTLLLLTFAGAFVTGVWALAQRLLVAPVVLFQTVGRVGYVAFSKVATPEEQQRQAQRVLGITALAAAALLAIIVGSLPALVGGVLGREWEGVILPVTLAAAGWMVLGPLWVALSGLLQARGDLRGPLIGGALQVAVLWTAAITLAPRFGARAIGAAFLAALILTAVVLHLYSRRFVRLRYTPLVLAAVIGTVAAAAGRAVADQLPSLAGLPLAASVALAVWLLLAMALLPRDLQSLATESGTAGILPSTGRFGRSCAP